MSQHYLDSRIYRCGPAHTLLPIVRPGILYVNTVVRKIVVHQIKMGAKKIFAEIELLGIKDYTKDTMIEIPAPSKKEVSLMFETVQNIGSFTNLGRQFDNSASYSTTEYPQDDGT